MPALLDHLPWLIAMAGLIGCSAFFSASEAAMFSLRWSDRHALASGTPSQQAVEHLLSDPDRLLSAVLFWNLMVNVVYFALASIVSLKLDKHPAAGQGMVAGFAVGSLLLLIFCSEMLPKNLAVLQARKLAGLVALPLLATVRLVDPVMPLLQAVNLVSRRLICPGLKQQPYLEVTDIERAIELSTADEAAVQQEKLLLSHIVALSDLRVDEWMRPRKQFRSFRPPISVEDVRAVEIPSGYLLVTEWDSDDITSALPLAHLTDFDHAHLENDAQEVVYLPWCATVADALEGMQDQGTEVSAVVNELGETIGILTLDDVLHAIFAEQPKRGERLLNRDPIVDVDPNTWHVAGVTNLRLLRKRFGVELPSSHSVTIGGVLQEELERLPHVGDQLQWGPFHIEVVRPREQYGPVLQLTLRPDVEEPA